MTFESRLGFRRDLARWVGVRDCPPPSAATKLVLANPGVQAVLLLRVQMALQASGRQRLARVVSLLNLRLTGVEFVVGCRVGPGLVLRHPQGIVIGGGSVIGEDCTILQQVTLGERYADGTGSAHKCPRVGARVVIGAGAVILGDVIVGSDAVIGANAVVLHDVDAADVVVGVPARATKALAVAMALYMPPSTHRGRSREGG